MDNFVRQTLQKIIQQYGTTVCDEPKRCENLLKDLCPQHKREVHVLITALHAQVAADLLKIPAGVPVRAVLIRLVQRLHDERAMQVDAAKWAVVTWAAALGVVSGVPQKAVVAPKPVIPVQVQQVIEPAVLPTSVQPQGPDSTNSSKPVATSSSGCAWAFITIGPVLTMFFVGLVSHVGITNFIGGVVLLIVFGIIFFKIIDFLKS